MSASSFCVLGTRLQICTYASLTADLQARSRADQTFSVDFTNTHIVTLRRGDPEFRALTGNVDYFIPDGMPLIWCLNRQGANLRDRVYGPTFMRECILNSPAPFTHYFLGGNDECVSRLREFFLKQNPQVRIIGTRNGYFKREDEAQILEEINRLSPDFIWIGLGTPKQQDWINRNKSKIHRGIVLAVGFAFDVNAGTKPDAPMWMQRYGLTWVHRLASEPFRLGPRYVKNNSRFLFYLFWDGVRGKAWKSFGNEPC
jgi:N-acetylglucosaminyldiphosphoundecaprenol N-acetyl-beta-D-mannosaminyltransferase